MWGEVGGMQREVLRELLLWERGWDGSARVLGQRFTKVTYDEEHVLRLSDRSDGVERSRTVESPNTALKGTS